MGTPEPSDPRGNRRLRNVRRILTVALVLLAIALSDHFVRPAKARNPKPPAPPALNAQSDGSGTSGVAGGASGGKGPRWAAWNGFLDDANAHRHRPPHPPEGWGSGRHHEHDYLGGGVPGGGDLPWGGVLPVLGPDEFGSLALPHDGLGGGPGGSGGGPGGPGGGPGGSGAGPGGGSGGPNGGPGKGGNGGPGGNENQPLVIAANDLAPTGNQRTAVPEPDVTVALLTAFGVLLTLGRVAAKRGRLSLSLRPR
jgi:hypothetical protein